MSFIARALLVISRMSHKAGTTLQKNIHLSHIKRTARLHDMSSHPDEDYYAEQYMKFIAPELNKSFPDKNIKIIDLACGQGRLTLPLAKWNSEAGGKITGVDFTVEALDIARENTKNINSTQIEFKQSDALDYLNGVEDSSVDAVICVEALYMIKEHKAIISEIRRVLKSKGLVFLGLRPEIYSIVEALRQRHFDGATLALKQHEGELLGGPVHFSWCSSKDVEDYMTGFTDIKTKAIGLLSDIEGGPRANIARPSNLPPDAQKILMKLETELAGDYPDAGRYMLVIATKKS